MSAGHNSTGDLPKWRANCETCWTYEACVWGDRFLICMSSSMRWRRGVMTSSLRHGWRAEARPIMSQRPSECRIAEGRSSRAANREGISAGSTRVPPSGLVQPFLCVERDYVAAGSGCAGTRDDARLRRHITSCRFPWWAQAVPGMPTMEGAHVGALFQVPEGTPPPSQRSVWRGYGPHRGALLRARL